jgi:hypothetical protein
MLRRANGPPRAIALSSLMAPTVGGTQRANRVQQPDHRIRRSGPRVPRSGCPSDLCGASVKARPSLVMVRW